jgi:hypothetical protein
LTRDTHRWTTRLSAAELTFDRLLRFVRALEDRPNGLRRAGLGRVRRRLRLTCALLHQARPRM